jgi:hypothetical protein
VARLGLRPPCGVAGDRAAHAGRAGDRA